MKACYRKSLERPERFDWVFFVADYIPGTTRDTVFDLLLILLAKFWQELE